MQHTFRRLVKQCLKLTYGLLFFLLSAQRMKLCSVISLGLVSACPDQDLGNECAVDCQRTLIECITHCSDDETCSAKCDRDFPDCVTACPCYEGCPLGCEKCPHPICGGSGGCVDQDLGDWCILACQGRDDKKAWKIF